MGLFVLPPIGVFTNPERAGEYSHCSSYSHYNYLRPGVIQRLKRGRFELALALAKPFFNSGDVLDFGCADGVFLCSLAKYFPRVVGVDQVPKYLSVAQDLVDAVPLKNVTLVCNEGLSFEDLQGKIGRKFRVAFVLETLEHVGQLPDLYGSKADFVAGVLSLMEPDGVVIISVPRMVGIRFFIKHMIQRTLRIPTDEMTFRELLRAAFLYDTNELEPKWNGGHSGFNHQKLTTALKSRFDLLSCKGNLTSVFYVVRARAGGREGRFEGD
jgi:2-polyprenyl-3-methyl-5-hydroxy-6-metoxy-1,4-benzoquinol methylase